jgi:hypothetical protein
MTRSALALLGLLALPAAAAAQDRPLLGNEPPPQRLPESRFSVSPFIGLRVPYNTGDYVVFFEDGGQTRVEEERGGGSMVGLNFTARLTRTFSLVAGAAYTTSEQDLLFIGGSDESDPLIVESDGPAVWFAKAGVQVRLPDPVPDNRRFHPSAFITVAPAVVWMDWAELDGAPDEFSRSSRHVALNIAADAVTRIGRGNWALTLGVEDYLTFWNTDALRVRDESIGEVRFGEPVVIDYDYNSSNIFALKVGVSYLFGQ